MKDSGIDWIGLVPDHWEMERAKFLFRQSTSKGNSRLVLLSATQDRGVIDKSKLEGVVQVDEKADLNTFKTVHINDFVISLRSFQGGFELCYEEGVISPAYTVFRMTKQSYPYYYKYLFKSNGFIDKLNSITVGIREGKNIKYDDFANLLIPSISVEEQKAIAEFLDRKCGEVDEMVALQEQVIEELKAYKQSIITEAVTKGLNPSAPMKPSGIDWIGEIPEGWDICRIKDLFILKTGTTPKSYDEGLQDEKNLVNWFTPSDISEMNCILSKSERHLRKDLVIAEGIKLYPIGSLMFVGIGALAGKIGYAVAEGYSNQQITAMIPKNDNLISKYAYYFMLADRKRIRDNAFYTTLPIINNSYLNGVTMLCPPLSEQREIAEYLDRKCADIDALIALKQQKIEELKAYKKSLIYEYVTGKKAVSC